VTGTGGTTYGAGVVAALEAARAAGTHGRNLLEHAVRRIEEAASGRFDWVGVYLLEGDVLELGPYVGAPTDHVRIPVGRGVCGTAVAEDRDINVPDVRELDNYIACSVGTRSELVVLIREPGSGRVLGQLDLDSDRVAAFTPEDERELKLVADWLGAALGGGI
jgi:L-methionine (R)-S-oxide reductase